MRTKVELNVKNILKGYYAGIKEVEDEIQQVTPITSSRSVDNFQNLLDRKGRLIANLKYAVEQGLDYPLMDQEILLTVIGLSQKAEDLLSRGDDRFFGLSALLTSMGSKRNTPNMLEDIISTL
jgi:hypothetical protein